MDKINNLTNILINGDSPCSLSPISEHSCESPQKPYVKERSASFVSGNISFKFPEEPPLKRARAYTDETRNTNSSPTGTKLELDDDDDYDGPAEGFLVLENGPNFNEDNTIMRRWFGLPTLTHHEKYHTIDYIKKNEFWYEVESNTNTKQFNITAHWNNNNVKVLDNLEKNAILDIMIEIDECKKRIDLEDFTKAIFKITI